MRMYRNIATEFWTDSKVEQADCNDKLLMLYLLTAPHGNLAGCYEVTFNRIENETGMKAAQARKSLGRLCELGMVSYSEDTNEVLLLNWSKYNWSRSPKTKAALDRQIERVKNPQMRAVLAREYERCFSEPYPYPIDTVSKGMDGVCIPPVSVSVSVSDTEGLGVQGEGEPKPSKHRRGEFGNVLLTDEEMEKLRERFPSDLDERIANLDLYIGKTGKSYKSHYLTIISWARNDAPSKGAGKYAKYD